jgi:pimeloyl-ACP methyl ester carboxylesterase
MSKEEIKQMKENIYFSALPITRRSEGILFDQWISNPSIDEAVPFGNIITPTLIINAIDDPATLVEVARRLSRDIPKSELVLFEEGGHLLPGHEEEIKHIIGSFIRKR